MFEGSCNNASRQAFDLSLLQLELTILDYTFMGWLKSVFAGRKGAAAADWIKHEGKTCHNNIQHFVKERPTNREDIFQRFYVTLFEL